MSDAATDLALDLIAKHEGYRDTVYLCPAGVPTVGYGTTHYPNGTAVRMGDPTCTEPQARRWLENDAAGASKAVDRLVSVPLTAGQHAALVSFVYNFSPKMLSASTLLLKLNRGDYDGAAGEFGRWVRGGGKVLPGLVRRRAEEAALFVRR
jgi:lysozyme